MNKEERRKRNTIIAASSIVLAGLGYGLSKVFSLGGIVEKFSYAIKDISFYSSANFLDYVLKGIPFEIDLEIKNNTNRILTFDFLSIDIFYKDTLISELKVSEKETIHPNGIFLVKPLIYIPLKKENNEMYILLKELTTSTKPMVYIQGNISVEGIEVIISEDVVLTKK